MLKRTSKNFKKYFLLEFTKELIRSTNAYRNLRINKEVKLVVHEPKILPTGKLLQKKDVHIVIKDKIARDSEIVSQMKREDPFGDFFRGKEKQIRSRLPPRLKIPDPILPPTFQHIQPRPTRNQINLGKLNPLVNDPMVRVIECNGPDEKIIVMGAMGRKATSISLSKEEINEVIHNFSQATKIPVPEGIFKVVFGRLILSVIVSEVIGSKFLIKKISGPPAIFRR